jgi:hypothetical protein
MIRKPIIVADAMRANSFLSGLVHFFTKCMLSFTNCLKGWTITALTSDIVGSLRVRCGSLSLGVAAATGTAGRDKA